MNKLLDPSGKLMTLVGRVGDHFLLSLLWLLCSIPIVTAGAAAAAMCQVSFRVFSEEECHLLPDFFAAFKQQFKPATKLHLAAVAVGLVFVLDVYFYLQVGGGNGTLATMILGMILLIAAVALICLIWLYPYLTLYGGGFLQTVKMAFLLGISNLGWSALMLAVDVALAFGSLFATFLIPFVPGIITLINTLCIRKALAKYRREDEEDSSSF